MYFCTVSQYPERLSNPLWFPY